MIPTSSNDPYAPRRYAYGIVRILLNEKWSLPFNEVLPEIINMLNGVTPAKLPKGDADQEIADFIRDRVKQYCKRTTSSTISLMLSLHQVNKTQVKFCSCYFYCNFTTMMKNLSQ